MTFSTVAKADAAPRVDTTASLWISGAALVVLLSVVNRYGYFVDALYYLACSRHLSWGYVDQPPLIALITWIVRVTLEQSLPAIRFMPRCNRSVRTVIRTVGGDQRSSELLSVGAAGVHGRKHDRDGRQGRRSRAAFRERAEGREHRSSVLSALRAFRRVLLPRHQEATQGTLATDEAMGLIGGLKLRPSDDLPSAQAQNATASVVLLTESAW